MKPLFFSLLLTVSLLGCKKTPVTVAEVASGASFKEGHGVQIPPEMQKSLGLEVFDVAERKIFPQLEIPLHVVRGADAGDAEVEWIEAGGWVSGAQAAAINPGQQGRITTPNGSPASCRVLRVDKAADAALGDFEVVAQIAASLPTGTTVTATFEIPETGEVVAVPPSAVMKTAEGEFVYAVNEAHFKRVPVQTGVRSADAVEITDGLYAGDQIVSARVIPLWMTELQTLRAGQSCCKGR